MISDSDFFHQATLKICSSIDIEEVAEHCFEFLKEILPLNGIMMNYYDAENRDLIILAMRSTLKLNTVSSVSVDADGQAAFRELKRRVAIIGRPEENPVTTCIWKALGRKAISSLVLYLWYKGKRLGQVELFVRGYNRFTPEHGRLLGLLHDPFAIAIANNIQYREVVRLKNLLADDNRTLLRELHRVSATEIIGAESGLQNVMESVVQVAPLNSQVLLLGETGVGKEIIANAIHQSSPRRDGPFVKINCGAIPEGLIDSELFGHEKGAFTGAISRKYGRFERAQQGTIFLDEVGDLPAAAQVRLLRVLQEKEIERVGGTRPVKVDVRVIAATNRNLEDLVRRGWFREDLWFRLNVFPIPIPPLRERKSDIPGLVHHFIMKKSRELNFSANPLVAPGAMERLMAYDWPGNVRELENIVERALIRMRTADPNSPMEFDELPVRAARNKESETTLRKENQTCSLDEVVKQHILEALEKTGGKIHGRDGAAALLGINASTLRNRMRRLGIPFGRKH